MRRQSLAGHSLSRAHETNQHEVRRRVIRRPVGAWSSRLGGAGGLWAFCRQWESVG
jgi:hypothetical protein